MKRDASGATNALLAVLDNRWLARVGAAQAVIWIGGSVAGLAFVVWGAVRDMNPGSIVLIILGVLLLLVGVANAVMAFRHRPAREPPAPEHEGSVKRKPPLTSPEREKLMKDFVAGAAQGATDAIIRKASQTPAHPAPESSFDTLAKKRAAHAYARRKLRQDLEAALRAGEEFLHPIDMPQYAMSSAAANNFRFGITEKEVREWAVTIRKRLEDPELVELFDHGPDLPPPPIVRLPAASASREQLVAFLKAKLSNAQKIVNRLSG
jgi:hypothetical protein